MPIFAQVMCRVNILNGRRRVILWRIFILRVQSYLCIFVQKYLCKCEYTYFILQNTYLCICKDSFGPKILLLRDDCTLRRTFHRLLNSIRCLGYST